MTRHVVLLGLMGAGKTSVGRIVADRLGLPLVDGDERLAELTGGRTAAEVAEERGIDALHAMESEIASVALAGGERSVIGPASSVCEVAAVRDAMAGHDLVWLTASAEHLATKAVQKDHRPLLDDGDPVELFRHQLAVREPLVLALDPLVVDVSADDDDAAADLIVNAIGP